MFEGYCLGICRYDLPAFILLLVILAAILIHNHRFKKKRDEYQMAIEEKKRIIEVGRGQIMSGSLFCNKKKFNGRNIYYEIRCCSPQDLMYSITGIKL